MKRMMAALCGISLLLGTAGLAFAQDKKGDKVGDYQKVKKYEFDADDVSGDIIKPLGEAIGSRTELKHASLIRIRTDFIAEIIKSAEDM